MIKGINMKLVLNKEQKAVVNETEGLISVVAGPGSGKTKTLIERAKSILTKNLCYQNEILLITFTNKVRHEIVERLKLEIPNNKIQVHTFHSYAIEIIKKYAYSIGLTSKLKIIESSDIKILLEEAYLNLFSKNSNFNIQFDYDELINSEKIKYKNRCSNLNESKLIEEFLKIKLEHNYTTYDDLIDYLIKILKTDCGKEITDSIKYLMVDECQDLNDEQYGIIQLFEENQLKNILLVGDIDQSIYAWRGAKPELFNSFRDKSHQLHLITNYRSKKDIVDCSQKLIKNNKDRIDIDFNVKDKDKGHVIINSFEDRLTQASEIVKYLADKKVYLKSKIAILFRANYLAHDFINCLYQYNIPFNNFNDVEFYTKKEIKDVLCLLRLISDKNDLIAWRYVLQNANCLIKDDYIDLKNISGNDIFEQMCNYIEINNLSEINKRIITKLISSIQFVIKNEDDVKVIDQIVYLLKTNDYKKRVWKSNNELINNVQVFLAEIEDAEEHGIKIEDFLINLGMGDYSSNEKTHDNTNVDLLTIHSSKGLEYDHVFVVDVNNDVLPHKRTNDLEEERRLLYVAITRAKDKLNVSYVSNSKARASVFIQEII